MRNLLAPSACSCCDARLIEHEHLLCTACQLELPRTHYAYAPTENEMAQIFWHQLPIERAAALFFYEGLSAAAQMIYDIKYRDRPDKAYQLGLLSATELADSGFFKDIDFIVPVPLAPKRQAERGYNQAEELALGLSHGTGIAVNSHCVKRCLFNGSQTQLGHWGRADNVKDSFVATNTTTIEGRHILLVDDVCTTGATLIACGQAITAVAHVRISIFTLAVSAKIR